MKFKAMLVAAALSAAQAAHAGPIVNGNFETGDLSGWTASGNVASSFDWMPYFGAGVAASNGLSMVAFNAGDSEPNGTLSQTFATTAGTTYLVSYDFGVTTDGNQGLNVSVWGSSGQLASDAPFVSYSGLDLSHFTFSFVADGDTATLQFSDRAQNWTYSQDAMLDNVDVTAAVPEPASLALLGLGFLGLATSRRRQSK